MRRVLPLIALMSAGCDAGFDVSRHDLGPFRIAALGVVDGSAEAMIWSGQGLYHESQPALEWTLDGAPLGEGYGVEVLEGGVLGLTVTGPDGERLEASVTVGQAPDAPTFERAAVDLSGDLDLESRRGLAGEPLDGSAPAGSAVRLALVGLPDGHSLRWMSAGGAGTLLELEVFEADVLAEEVVWDDGEVVSRTETGAGFYHQLALTIDGAGGNRWDWVDAAIGVDGPLIRHEGRLLAGDVDTSTGLIAATLIDSADLAGIALTELSPVTDLSEQEELGCAELDVPFRLAWVADGRCPRPEVLGARVVLEVE